MASTNGSFRSQAQEANSDSPVPKETPTTTTTTTSTATALPAHKSAFLSACLSASVLTFGTYTLKSGRQSPYFFNAGLLHTGSLLESIGTAYAHTILDHIDSNPSSPLQDFDIVFGPAYKGIPLATETLGALRRLDRDKFGGKSYSFNRKEVKGHGEGGVIVGASLSGRKVVIVDDVITAGTALREAVGIIVAEGGKVVGVVVALDRMERMPSEWESGGKRGASIIDDHETERMMRDAPRGSAVGEVRRALGVPVLSVLTLDDLIDFSRDVRSEDDSRRMEEYRAKYLAQD
ncbi:MAG: orotate phosphoribosyltransferase [Pleopsidium flavum]|nr:MAG: orotate phosphoribosyltransferase [Pleopsidium flavum]